MNKWCRGQMTVEAATLMILVVAGILLGGPVAIRGINAYFQSGEESVKESLREDIRSAGLVEGEFETCECSEPAALGCGDGGCNSYQMHYARVCNPANCHSEWCAVRGVYCDFDFCQSEETCCDPWANTGRCGLNADPTMGLGGQIPGGCPDGFMEQSQDCGSGVINYQCVADPLCEFNCVDNLGDDITSISDYRAVWCPGDIDSGLTGDTSAVFVQDAADCNGAKCQAYCLDTYTALANRCDCDPPTITVESGGRCYCDWSIGYIDTSGCPAGECVNDGCATVNECRVDSPY